MIDPVASTAPPEAVWQLLRDEAAEGVETGQAEILVERPPRELLIEVRMGIGFRVQHAYRIERRADGCRLSDRIRPLGWRWRLSNVVLFGRGLRPIEAAAHQGLLNLSRAAASDYKHE
ncbi:MAG: hypothetical protein OXH13_09365 [Chloroflexi bacterium]|nr:hypothetical protein [Chloroflexota bacterium]MCY3697681.1 hypothetical protein [Chloroflexota bacterium]